MGGGIIDGSGTINPAALNSAGLSNPSSLIATDTTSRGLKRSRSPESYNELPLSGEGDDNDDSKPRKRGRPPKPNAKGPGAYPPSPTQSNPQQPPSATAPAPQAQTPQAQSQGLPPPANVTPPTQTSPAAKSTPTKAVVKALPTVRDHTTDQLGPEGDEYIPREYDEAGERKVTPTGHPLDGREYKCRTFFVPNRHDKLFMLATECARVLGYRDSYLLFNKNRSLYKIIATQAEKDDLIHQEILPYSYRSRQIAIVTAKSMFRQFGSRVIVNGRRVKDDYWESKARKQGFTEEDMAGEKRPGAAKARDAAAAEAANAAAASAHHADIVYSNGPSHLDAHMAPQALQGGLAGPGSSLAPLPMILPPTDDMRLRDYGNVPRPRQEISGQPYQDRTQANSGTDMMNQAQHTADFNKALTQQRGARGKYLDDFWNKPREPVAGIAPPPSHGGGPADPPSVPHQALPSPQLSSGGLYSAESPAPLQHPPRGAQPMMNHQQAYSQQQQQQQHQQQQQQQQHQQQQQQQQQSHAQHSLAQSPIRSMPQGSIRPEQMHHRSPNLNLGSTTPNQAGSPYGYSPHSQMWPPSQPQPSPLSQSHHPMPQYSPHVSHGPPAQASPHQPSHQIHQGGPPPMQGGSLPYQGMPAMGPSGYHPVPAGRGLYQPNQSPQHFMHQTTAGAQPGMQGWAPPPAQQSPHGPQGWSWGTSG
ncbi:MAG: hypothetical protein M1838_000797 [Thelocarpon superellum]|nr:MAG: hypothetical protein M1838_000797 [Thelocarpon superellum]